MVACDQDPGHDLDDKLQRISERQVAMTKWMWLIKSGNLGRFSKQIIQNAQILVSLY